MHQPHKSLYHEEMYNAISEIDEQVGDGHILLDEILCDLEDLEQGVMCVLLDLRDIIQGILLEEGGVPWSRWAADYGDPREW